MRKTIGENIAAIRKEKGITQEQLSKSVMVSAQAVSKWENGGMPDAELLPAIADCLGVSVDALFGRSISDSNLEAALMSKIANIEQDKRISTAFNLLWNIERALFGDTNPEEWPLEEVTEKSGCGRTNSGVQWDSGFTHMGISPVQYFLAVPNSDNIENYLLKNVDYISFFKDLSDKNVFDALVFLNKRDHNKSFTPNLLVKNLGIDEATAVGAISTLKKYHMIWSQQIEMDDEVKEVYEFKPMPYFIGLLIFAHDMIAPPNSWYNYSSGRNKPYLA